MNPFVLIDGRPAQGRPRGIGVYVLRLIPALAALTGRDVDFKVALDKRQGEDPWPELNSIEKVWSTGFNPADWEQRRLPQLATYIQASLLHCTANGSPLRCNVPTLVTIHDAIFMRRFFQITGSWYPRQMLAHWYYRYGVAFGARHAARIITDSEYSKTEIVKKLRLKPEKIQVIHLANPHMTPPLPEAKVQEVIESLQIRRPYLLGFGAIDLRKNTDNLVRAFARLPRSAVELLVLAGFEKSRYSSAPALIKRLGLKKRIRILDYVSEHDLTALFQGASAFVYPTRMEGFGLPILQAFHLGVPVVTSRVGSVPEVAGNACRFANPDDPRSICEEILNILIDSNEAHRLALSGYLQAKHFTWELAAQKTCAVYTDVLGEILHFPRKAETATQDVGHPEKQSV